MLKRCEDWILMHLGYRAWQVYNALLPAYLPTSWADNPEVDYFNLPRMPFFIAWSLRWWRDIQIGFLTWAVRNRNRVSL